MTNDLNSLHSHKFKSKYGEPNCRRLYLKFVILPQPDIQDETKNKENFLHYLRKIVSVVFYIFTDLFKWNDDSRVGKKPGSFNCLKEFLLKLIRLFID